MSFRQIRVTLLHLTLYATCSACVLFGQQATNHPWSLKEIIEHSQGNPRDTFSTFAAVRLAESRGMAERNRVLRALRNRRTSGWDSGFDGGNVNWLGFTSGALALQESLQLEHLQASVPSTDAWDVDLLFGEDWRVAKERRDAADKTWSTSKSSPANSISLAFPTSLTFDPDGNLAIVDRESNRVFLLDSDGQMTGIRQKQSGEDENYGFPEMGDGEFGGYFLQLISNGDICVVDRWYGTISLITRNGKLTTLVDGPRLEAIEAIPRRAVLTPAPCAIAFGKDRSIYLAESFAHRARNGTQYYCRIRRRDLDGKVETIATLKSPLASTGYEQFRAEPFAEADEQSGGLEDQVRYTIKDKNERIGAIVLDLKGELVFSEGRHLSRVDLQGAISPIANRGDPAIADGWFYRASLTDAVGGDGGPIEHAIFQGPSGLAFDRHGNLFVADAPDHCVRKVSSSGKVSTIAGTCIPGFSGDGGLAIEAQLTSPHGLVVDADGNLFITDSGNGLVRKVDPSGIITTVAGKYLRPSDDDWPRRRRPEIEKSTEQIIDVAKLSGPKTPSLPFKEMLGDRRPEVSALAEVTPRDYYYIHFDSLKQAAEIAGYATQIGRHLESQSVTRGYSTQLGERIRQQLVLPQQLIDDDKINSQVQEVAIVGSDLYWELGSDFSFLFRFDPAKDFLGRMESELQNAQRRNPGLEKSEFKVNGIACQSLTSKDRSVCAYSAILQPGIYVRCNSLTALNRITNIVRGPDLMPSYALSESLDFLYLRTLMPLNAEVEDGFVFLSDDFIRHQIGPRVRIKQSRRMDCFSNLFLLQHAGLLHQTQKGNVATSISELVAAGSLNSNALELLKCSMGGEYHLDDHGCAVCSVHGKIGEMVPCADLKLEKVSPREQFVYKRFMEQYSDYWQAFFDPIGMRIQFTPESYRLETIVLPLIDNSVYTRIAAFTESVAVEFEPAPLNDETILSIGLAIDKQKMLSHYNLDEATRFHQWLNRQLGNTVDLHSFDLNVHEFLMHGIGNQFQFHVCDSTPNLTFNAAQDMAPASFGGLLVTSLMSPVYAVIPIENADVVNRFLRDLEPVVSQAVVANTETGLFPMRQSFATYLVGDLPVRRYSIEVAGVGIHFHIAAIGDQIIIANQPEIIQRLIQKPHKQQFGDISEEKGNVFVRMIPSKWNQMLLSHQLHLESANCDACLQKLGPLTNIARSGCATIEEAQSFSQEKYGLTHVCPSGGRYEISESPNGPPEVICSVHGDRHHPKQPMAPLDGSNLKRLAQELEEISAMLEITPEGIRAVLQIERNSFENK